MILFYLKECFPFEEANNSDYFFFEAPNHGGHVWLYDFFYNARKHWLELRIERFIKENIQINLL